MRKLQRITNCDTGETRTLVELAHELALARGAKDRNVAKFLRRAAKRGTTAYGANWRITNQAAERTDGGSANNVPR